MSVWAWILACAAGLATGVVSAWGVGGGTLLVLYMAAFTKLEQQTAQGINLIYFIPVAVAALVTHIKNKLIVWRAVIPAIIAGLPTSIGLALVATRLESDVVRKIFGGFVLAVGLFELFCKNKEEKSDAKNKE
ncbi:MAG: sulfite exporter TauE/SafE family protein [Oscillospiraceae bacterium]|jgi:uncharacterized membrane protein YfcA|nr:sulfite exporter TauE/SafE family protein [Oscillospiraceae bacterium]